jgi:hypothetical protein
VRRAASFWKVRRERSVDRKLTGKISFGELDLLEEGYGGVR